MERKLETLPESLSPELQKELSEILAALPELEPEESNDLVGPERRKEKRIIKSLFTDEEIKPI